MSSFRHAAVVAPLLLVVLVCSWAGTGCGKPTKEVVDRWLGSEPGMRRIAELVADPEGDRELRLYSLEKLCRNGYGLRARAMVQELADGPALAKELTGRLVAALNEGETTQQLAAKDSLLQFLAFLPDAEHDAILAAVAGWAFHGLDADADSDTVRKWFESHIGVSELISLGRHGVEGAATLMAHGFGVQELYDHLFDMEDPEVDQRMLDAFERLHKVPNIDIPLDHLDKIRRLRTPEAVVYLLRLYSNRDLPADIRGDAFGYAIKAFQQPEIRSAPDKLLPGLYAILADAANDDRRLATHYILRLGGVDQLRRVLATLRDDGTFDIESYDTPRFVRDICRDDVLRLRGDPVPILIETLLSGNRLTRLLATVCLKLSQRIDVVPSLEALLEDTTPLHDLVAEGSTLGVLARNAIDGLHAVGALTQRRDGGRIDEARYVTLRSLYEDELVLTGSELDAAVRKRAKERRKKVRQGEELP